MPIAPLFLLVFRKIKGCAACIAKGQLNMANVDPDEMETCSICIEEIPWRDVVKFKRCQHGICAQCYDEFSLTSNKCPVCRQLIQDPDELFQECLQKLVISLTRTNAALRRMRTAGQIRIDPSTETSSLLKTVQEKFHHLGGLMADTGITPCGNPNSGTGHDLA